MIILRFTPHRIPLFVARYVCWCKQMGVFYLAQHWLGLLCLEKR